MEPALQLPVGGECHFHHTFVPNTIAAQQILIAWPSTANTILPQHSLEPFYWLVVRQNDHHGLSSYGALSPWCTSIAIYSATAPSSAHPRAVGREPSQLTPSTDSRLVKQVPGEGLEPALCPFGQGDVCVCVENLICKNCSPVSPQGRLLDNLSRSEGSC